MLVSYDIVMIIASFWVGLQGHQNVGELRLRKVLGYELHHYCRVTRMLVSYDRVGGMAQTFTLIAGSPECW